MWRHSPGRTTSLAEWTCIRQRVPKWCCPWWTPPAWCWPSRQTQPPAAGCGCESPKWASCGRGNRTGTLRKRGRKVWDDKNPTYPRTHVTSSFWAPLTFDKKSYGQRQTVDADRHQAGCSGDQQHHPIDTKEQIHGAVLPVHQLHPAFFLKVVEMCVRSVGHKLLHHDTWEGTTAEERPGWDQQRPQSHSSLREGHRPTKEANTARPPSV